MGKHYKKGEEPTIHLLPSIQEVLGVREGDKAVLGLVSNEQRNYMTLNQDWTYLLA